jgi:hypothetical protein
MRGGGAGCVAVVRGALVTEDAYRPLLDDPRGGTRDSGPTGAFRCDVVLLQALEAPTHQVGGDRATFGRLLMRHPPPLLTMDQLLLLTLFAALGR